jgi:hypothetical protein
MALCRARPVFGSDGGGAATMIDDVLAHGRAIRPGWSPPTR